MKCLKRIITILLSFSIIIGGFIISHMTPSMSVRTHIFVSGYPIGAFRGTVKVNKGQYNMDKNILDEEGAMIYTVAGYNLYDRETRNVISNYKVKKIKFLYFTERYGEC